MAPFFSTRTGGTGIGLTICQVVLKAHGGNLHFGANEPYETILRVALHTPVAVNKHKAVGPGFGVGPEHSAWVNA